jgi:2-methylcitrate dehydratase PrpD
MNAIDSLIDHVLLTRFEDLPTVAVAAAKTFIFDSVGVGISGARHPRTAQVRRAAAEWGAGRQARVWCSGEYLPASAAAMVNAWQVHNQEFDCVHEQAVVHPMATILPTLMASAEKRAAAGEPVSGRELILAVVLAVDVATTIGMAQGAPMRFFRPAMCGALGAAAGLAKLAGAERELLHNTLGITYSHLSGTMQAHLEGSPTLAMQVGLNARAALSAFDLAQQGFSGPKDILEGPFGYFALFDGQADWASASRDLGKVFQITRVSHKPFATGRAAHGALDGLLRLRAEHGFNAADVASVVLLAPPLVVRLVGRPARAGMDANYARLCLGYLMATALQDGTVSIRDFAPERLADASRLQLAQCVSVAPNHIADPNALAPQSMTITLTNGKCLSIDMPAVLGHPDRPLSLAQQQEKFAACCNSAGPAWSATQIAQLADTLAHLDQLADVRTLIDQMIIVD